MIEYAVLFTDSAGVTHVASGSVAGTAYLLDDLSERAVYRFQLRAHNAKGWSLPGKWSEPITMPVCGASRPDAPSKAPVVTQLGTCSATVQWHHVGGRATGGAAIDSQELRAIPASLDEDYGQDAKVSSNAISAIILAGATEGTVSGLQAQTAYRFTFRVHNVSQLVSLP